MDNHTEILLINVWNKRTGKEVLLLLIVWCVWTMWANVLQTMQCRDTTCPTTIVKYPINYPKVARLKECALYDVACRIHHKCESFTHKQVMWTGFTPLLNRLIYPTEDVLHSEAFMSKVFYQKNHMHASV